MMKFYTKSLSFIVAGTVLSFSANAQVFMNNAGAKMNITSGSYLNVDGTFENQTSGAIENNGTIEVLNNWTNNDAGGVFSTNAGTVILDGGAQTIDGTERTFFNNLTLSGTPSSLKTMNTNVLVGGGYGSPSGVLTLNSGGAHTLVLNSNELEISNPLNSAIVAGTGRIRSETTPGSGYGKVIWDIKTTGPTQTTNTFIGGGITINASGTASPYSSNITVAAMPTIITGVSVNINGLTHTNPEDIDILLVSPSGQRLALMSDCGSTNSITGVNLTFQNSNVNPYLGSTITTGTYRPTNYAPVMDNYPSIGAIFPHNTLSAFDGGDPNGTWSLYVVDDQAGAAGSITSWSITITSTASLAGTSYVVPFATAAPTDIPFTYILRQAGSETSLNAGKIKFATYPTADDNTPWATTVTHMNNEYNQPSDLYVIDRFWIIEHEGFVGGSHPKSDYIFKWDPNDILGNPGINLPDGSGLRAQRFNPFYQNQNNSLGAWGDWLYSPAANVGTQTLQISIANEFNGNSSGGDYLPVWTLVDESNPLPIELIRFAGNCADEQVEITWTTASETNNDFFTVQRSIDGVTFEDVTIVDGAGNSSSIINYSAVDYNPYGGTSYYRLKQTDFDGTSQYSDVVAVSCGNAATDFNLVNAYDQGNGTMAVVFNAGDNELYTVTLYDIIGKQITETTGKAYSGQNQINIAVGDLARGIYMVNLKNEFKSFGRRVMLH